MYSLTLLTATTRNSYSSLGVSSGIVAVVWPPGTVTAGSQLEAIYRNPFKLGATHRPYLVRFSTWYSVIGAPPSVVGGSHLMST